MTDTAPNQLTPEDHPDYEPPVEGEDARAKRARKQRNRRRAIKAQEQANPEPAGTPTRGRPSVASKRAQSVTGVVTGIGIGVAVWNEGDGTAIIEGAPALGDALAKVAEKNRSVARALDAFTETSAWAELAFAVAAIAGPIAKNHGIGLDTLTKPKPAPEPATRATIMDPNEYHPRTPPADPTPPPQVADDAPVFTVRNDAGPEPVPTFQARHA